jgi:aspartate/methionine/tyrosine aminotransferase
VRYKRMPIEVESPEEYGYGAIRYNLSESSIADQTLSGLGLVIPDLTLLYTEHRGSQALRASVVEGERGLGADDVLVTVGAAGALFIIATSLLSGGDHLVVVRPNYATNLETPRAIGCDIGFVDLKFQEGFETRLDRIAAAITPRTKLISITTPHNPTGVRLGAGELKALADLAAERGCRLLVDETYRELAFDGATPVAAGLGPHVISVASLSKAFGVPGIRIGWLVSKDQALMEVFLAAKEQISICGSVVDEWIAEQILARRRELLPPILSEMRRRRDRVAAWIADEPLLEWVAPAGGVVGFPRMTAEPAGGVEAFYRRLLGDHETYVGPGHWFEQPDTSFRVGYGWPTAEELEGGLEAISKALRGKR